MPKDVFQFFLFPGIFLAVWNVKFGSCRANLPSLSELQARIGDKGVERSIFDVSINEVVSMNNLGRFIGVNIISSAHV